MVEGAFHKTPYRRQRSRT